MLAIFWKEAADHFGRRRSAMLFGLVMVGVIWGAFVNEAAIISGGTGFFYLDIFTTTSGVPLSLHAFIAFFGPIIGIALGFDSINGERTQGTLSRILAQPVHRDDVYNGKFLAGLLTLAVAVFSMGVAVVGIGMFRLGVPPSGDEMIRLTGFGLIVVLYLSFWLALAMAASIFLRNAVASALMSLTGWIVLSIFVGFAATTAADRIVPEIQTEDDRALHAQVQLWVGRVSPEGLFSEATGVLLDPIYGRFLNPFAIQREQVQGLDFLSPVSAGQSLQLVWPHIVVLLAMVSVLLVVSYARFMREEIRA
jgi:ABC-2 type transport system permease protein